MTALVVTEAIAIVLLGLLVAGLLRSHAEILRRLHELGAGADDDDRGHPDFAVQPGVAAPGVPVTQAHDLSGVTPDDEAIVLGVAGVDHRTLLAFLSSGCLTCEGFWQAFADEGLTLPADTRLVVVTKGADEESASAIGGLAPTTVPVVMSNQAWDDYQVPGSPYFAFVDGPSGRVAGEGSATSWEQVSSLLDQGLEDARPAGGQRRPRRGADRDRADLIDRELQASGVRPGHPSLYPELEPTTDEEPAP
ncbi:MAG: hypothetical protein ACRDU8_02960 [Egibacteraceae bacterium]